MQPTSETIQLLNHDEIGWHVWQADATSGGGPLVLVFHGFLAHGRYPTVRYAAQVMAANLPGATIVAPDMPGHGMSSSGPRGYLPGGAQGLIANFGLPVLETARNKYGRERKVFLVGSSMGGTIALQVALREPPGSIAGVVLLAPMLKLKVSTVEEHALGFLSLLIPTWEIIPSSSTSSEKQYRDPQKRQECDNDPLTVKQSKIRVGSALTCVQLARTALQGVEPQQFTKFPVWNGVAEEDQVVDKSGSTELHQIIEAAGGSSTMQVYPALHGLLCEPSPLYDQITQDFLTWMKERL